MRVKHIHARHGEHIAVHRGPRPQGGGSGGGNVWGTVIAVLFGLWLVVSFWDVIVAIFTICMTLAILATGIRVIACFGKAVQRR